MTRLFVTGTDTGVGKTVVTAALLAGARARGQTAFGYKPAESGCEDRGGELFPADAAFLAEVAGHPVACPYRYRAPLAPAAAASIEGNDFEAEAARALWEEKSAAVDLAIAEGAGGLLVPLAPGYLIADLVADLGCPLLVVARDNLGTINHTALTLEVARARQLGVVGFVFSSTGDVDAARARANAEAITAITEVPYLGALPRLEHLDSVSLAKAARGLAVP